jgi:hypothetical protein
MPSAEPLVETSVGAGTGDAAGAGAVAARIGRGRSATTAGRATAGCGLTGGGVSAITGRGAGLCSG